MKDRITVLLISSGGREKRRHVEKERVSYEGWRKGGEWRERMCGKESGDIIIILFNLYLTRQVS